MNSYLAEFADLPDFVIRVAIVLAALMLNWRLPIAKAYHPIYFFQQVAERLADKVHPDPNRHKKQLVISGLLAMLSAILPVIIIFYLFLPLVEFVWFIDLIVLWICLSSQECQQANLKIYRALTTQQKLLARDRLSDWVLRDTQNLSELGIVKASIESQTLRSGYYYHAILFWYLLAGPVWVLAFRLLLELNACWNAKIVRFADFGKPTQLTLHLLAWLPMRLFAFILVLGSGIFKAHRSVKHCKNTWRYTNNLWPLAAISQSLKVQLGGAVSYAGNKVRRPQLNQYRVVSQGDMLQVDKILRRSQQIWLIIIVISASLVMIGHRFFSW